MAAAVDHPLRPAEEAKTPVKPSGFSLPTSMNIVERAKKLRDASYSIKDESQVKADLKGVAELMELGAWKSALRLSRSLLSSTTDLDELNKLDEALSEFRDIGNFDDSKYDLPDNKGSRIPFSMRLIYATVMSSDAKLSPQLEPLFALLSYCRSKIPQSSSNSSKKSTIHSANPNSASKSGGIDPRIVKYLNLKSDAVGFDILFTENKIDSDTPNKESSSDDSSAQKEIGAGDHEASSSEKLWRQRVLLVAVNIANKLLQSDDFISALNILREVIGEEKDNVFLLNVFVKILVQMGNMNGAYSYMDHIEKSLTLKYSAASMEELLVDGADKLAQAELTLVLGNRYLRAFAALDNAKMDEVFRRLVKAAPNDTAVVVNHAIAIMYRGKVRDAIKLLEDRVEADRPLCCQESVIFNLASMYELAYQDSLERKKSLFHKMFAFIRDDFPLEAFKIPDL